MDWMHWILWKGEDIKPAHHNDGSIQWMRSPFKCQTNFLPRTSSAYFFMSIKPGIFLQAFQYCLGGPFLIILWQFGFFSPSFRFSTLKFNSCFLRCCSSSSLDRPDFFTLRQAVKKLTEWGIIIIVIIIMFIIIFIIMFIIVNIIMFIMINMKIACSPQTMVAVLESLLVRMEQYANNLEVIPYQYQYTISISISISIYNMQTLSSSS